MKYLTGVKVLPATLLLTIFLYSCASLPEKKDNYVTPIILNKTPTDYDQKIVVVKGYVQLGTNSRILTESKERNEKADKIWRANSDSPLLKKYFYDCLTLLNTDLLWKNKEFFTKKTTVIFKGKFVSDYMDGNVVDLQACSETPSALILDEEYILEKYGQSMLK